MNDFNGPIPFQETLNPHSKSKSKVSWEKIDENDPESLLTSAMYGL